MTTPTADIIKVQCAALGKEFELLVTTDQFKALLSASQRQQQQGIELEYMKRHEAVIKARIARSEGGVAKEYQRFIRSTMNL